MCFRKSHPDKQEQNAMCLFLVSLITIVKTLTNLNASSESPHQHISTCFLVSPPLISPVISPYITLFPRLDDLLLCIFPHNPLSHVDLPFIPFMEALVTIFNSASPVKSALPISAHIDPWETLTTFLEPIIVSTGHLWWPSSDCGQHQQPPANPRETGAQANGLCVFLFGCSGVSLDKGMPPVRLHSVSTFLSSLVILGNIRS